MAYVHCRNCTFSQDDFWSIDGYHPFNKNNMNLIKEIIDDAIQGKTLVEMDLHWAEENNMEYTLVDGHANIDYKDMVAHELDRIKDTVYEMTWLTEKDYMADKEKRCPRCGEVDLDID